MEFIIQSDYFIKAISDVNRAVSLKTPFPILSGIKITASKDCLILIGSNSDIIIEKMVPLTIDGVKILDVYKTGSVVVSAKYLGEIVKKLPDNIHFHVNKKQLVTLQSNEIITRLNCFNSEEYPRLPQLDESLQVTLPCGDVIEMIKQTAFAVAKSETRPVLTGVNMVFKNNQLTCVATNSHRLALRELTIDSNINGSYIIPSTSLNELVKLMQKEKGCIQLFVTDSYMVFKSNSTCLFSRLIEGSYPNVSTLLPETFKTIMTLHTKQLLSGIDRASLFASEWKNNNVNLEIVEGKKLKLSSNSSEIGRIEEMQAIISLEGERALTISLDGSFLMDAIKVIEEEEVTLSFGGSMRPVLINPVGNTSYIHLISPVRTY